MPTIIRSGDTGWDEATPLLDSMVDACGRQITTERLMAAAERVMADPVMQEVAEMMMQSPAYIRGGCHAEEH